MKIIIVDDEITALNTFLINLVDHIDISYQLFNNEPTQALAYAKSNSFDVAFLDVNMPKMNGIELAKSLIKINPTVKIVLISGYEQDENKIRSEIGDSVVGFYYKPYGKEEMETLLLSLKSSVDKEIKIRTFGSFNVFVNDVAAVFSCAKSRELLAYLTDAEGGFVTMGSIITALWPDKNEELAKKLYKDAVFRLRRALKTYGVENLVCFRRAQLAVNTSKVDCDLWRYVNGEKDLYVGEYLTDYEWSLTRQLQLDALK